VFTVKSANGSTVGGEYTTGLDGKAVIPSLSPGSYAVSVLTSPENYIIENQSKTIEVIANQVIAVAFYGIEMPDLSISSLNADTGELIAGMRFSVTDENGAILMETDSLATEAVILEHLKPGPYTISIVNTADGYESVGDIQYDVEVRSDGYIYHKGAALDGNTLTFSFKSIIPENEVESTEPAVSETNTVAKATAESTPATAAAESTPSPEMTSAPQAAADISEDTSTSLAVSADSKDTGLSVGWVIGIICAPIVVAACVFLALRQIKKRSSTQAEHRIGAIENDYPNENGAAPPVVTTKPASNIIENDYPSDNGEDRE